MRVLMLLSAATLVGSVSAATAAEPVFAIPNPQRPGAKAQVCNPKVEAVDGCVFHTKLAEVNRALLPVAAGEHWTAKTDEPGVIAIRNADEATTADGAKRQVFEIVPNTPKDADAVVTFERLSAEQDGALKLIERRRVSVMIHPAS
jgi:hypothetical protein